MYIFCLTETNQNMFEGPIALSTLILTSQSGHLFSQMRSPSILNTNFVSPTYLTYKTRAEYYRKVRELILVLIQ